MDSTGNDGAVHLAASEKPIKCVKSRFIGKFSIVLGLAFSNSVDLCASAVKSVKT